MGLGFRIEVRQSVDILVDEWGCRPATSVEIEMWERIQELEAALKPFARAAEVVHVIPNTDPSETFLWVISTIANGRSTQVRITAADVLAAKTVLKQQESE